jgi:hypothetical protein
MDYIELVQVFYACKYLVEESACFWFFHSLVLDDVVEQFTSTSVFHDEVKLLGSLDNLNFRSG